MSATSQIARINNAIKINPFRVLNAFTNWKSDQIIKQYRSLSKLIHPDKCPDIEKPSAQDAFQKLGTAKKMLEDEEKREVINAAIKQARKKVLDNHKRSVRAKLIEQGRPPVVEDLQEPVDNVEYEEAVLNQLDEILIEFEWRRRQAFKAASERQGREKIEAEEREALARLKKEAEEKWEDGRNERVQDWRSFYKKTTKKRKLKPVTLHAEKRSSRSFSNKLTNAR